MCSVRNLLCLTAVTFAFLAVESLLGQESGENKPIPGVGPTGPIKKWHTGFKWSEGPIADGKGNVFFSDVQGSKLYKIDSEGKLAVYSDDLKGPNGCMFNTKGELVVCEMNAGRVVAFDVDS